MYCRYWLPSDGEEKKRPRRENSEKEERFVFSKIKKLYLLDERAAMLSRVCHFQIVIMLVLWNNLIILSRRERAFQDEDEVEAEVLQAWATFATGGEVQFSLFCDFLKIILHMHHLHLIITCRTLGHSSTPATAQ